MPEMREHELSRGAVLERERGAGLRVHELGMDEPSRAEVHSVLLLALPPERDADVADAHRLRDLRTPSLLELRAKRRLAATGLARDEYALDARSTEIEATIRRHLDEMSRVGRREDRGVRLQELDRREQALGVPGSDGDVAEADALERGKGRARHEGAGVVRGHDALAGLDAGSGVASRRPDDPVLEVARRQRDIARAPSRAARRIDPHDLGRLRTELGADRVLRRAGRLDLVLVGERELRDVGKRARGTRRLDSRRCELLAIERRALEEVRELDAIALVVDGQLLRPRTGHDLLLEGHALSPSYSTASSALAAKRKPRGFCCSSARCASRLAVRARIGTALTLPAG